MSVWQSVSVLAVLCASLVSGSAESPSLWTIDDITRILSSYLDSFSMFQLSQTSCECNRRVRNALTIGKPGWHGRSYLGRMILCDHRDDLERLKQEIGKSQECAALTFRDECHFVRGIPDGTDPGYTGQYSIKDRIQCGLISYNEWWGKTDPLIKCDWNPSNRAKWMTYVNPNFEWIAKKLDDENTDSEMKKEFCLKKINENDLDVCCRVIGSEYVFIQDHSSLQLYRFSETFGIGDQIGTLAFLKSANYRIYEPMHGAGLPKIIAFPSCYCPSSNQKQKLVQRASFLKDEKPEYLYGYSQGWNHVTEDGRYLLQFSEMGCGLSVKLTDVISEDVKITAIMDPRQFVCGPFAIKNPWYGSNDRYLFVSFKLWDFRTPGNKFLCQIGPNDRPAYYSESYVWAFFDLEKCEMIGTLNQHRTSRPLAWISDELCLFGSSDNESCNQIVSVHSPNTLISTSVPEFKNGFFRNGNEVVILDWEKK